MSIGANHAGGTELRLSVNMLMSMEKQFGLCSLDISDERIKTEMNVVLRVVVPA